MHLEPLQKQQEKGLIHQTCDKISILVNSSGNRYFQSARSSLFPANVPSFL